MIVALRVAGIEARTLALGGAFTAVIFGLAAQQTLGNLIAGHGAAERAARSAWASACACRAGRWPAQLEGTVSSLGLLYTTFATGEDSIMVPNSVVLNVAVLPLREPEAVNLRARLRAGMTPGRPAGDPREVAADAAARRSADHARGARRGGGGGADRRDAAGRRRRAVSWPANCWASSRARRARTRARRSAGTGWSRCAAPPAAPARRGRLELGRRRGSAAPLRPLGRRPASSGESDRNSSSSRPPASSWQRQVRTALAQQRCGRRSACRSSASAAARSSRPPCSARTYSTWAAVAGRLAAEAVRIATRAAGSASRGMSLVERQPSGDDARERLLAAARVGAQRPARGIGDDPPVALGADRAGAHEHPVDGARSPWKSSRSAGPLIGAERPPRARAAVGAC